MLADPSMVRNGCSQFDQMVSQFFAKDKMPARSCVGVKTLPLGALVEIECVAEIPGAV